MDNTISDLFISSNDNSPDFILDGLHFGRGESYIDETSATHLSHFSKSVKCWKIEDKKLLETDEDSKNHFYSDETYIVQWNVCSNMTLDFQTKNLIKTDDNEIYFYWKGENASKGFSPLPSTIEEENPSVERIVQWAEPPVFLQLFSGSFIVHLNCKQNFKETPHLYILRGEEDQELHLFEVPLSRQSLRSRTSFVLHIPNEFLSLIWHGSQANNHSQKSVRKITKKVFGNNIEEISEKTENDLFKKIFPKKDSIQSFFDVVDYNQRLFYLNNITGDFLMTEVENTIHSSYITPLPFLQSHFYTAIQPATFLLDDNDIIWIWQGWDYQKQNEEFRSLCFTKSIDYAKQKSNLMQKQIKVQKAVAGFEPEEFIKLFPYWNSREDVASIQEKNGELHTDNPLIEILTHND